MRLVTFRDRRRIRHGQLIEDGTVVQPLGDGDLGRLVELVHEMDVSALTASGPALPLADVEVLAPVSRPGKLLAVAGNYPAAGERSGVARRSPRLFLRPQTSIVGPGADIAVPTVGGKIAGAAGLGVVVGAVAHDVPVAKALDVVSGYLTTNDVSARSPALDADDPTDRFFDWLAGTWFDGFAPTGPWLVTPDEVPDPQDLALTLEVNGERRQHATTGDMVFSVAELVSYASRLMTLEPGDVLLTGAPPGEHLTADDAVSATVGGLGTLTNRVQA
jgi:2-keto-4-pentenoate hydratase/2-oxohepta-3-ene-1,7-dioic acid hydratase in catechol pathway